MDIKDIKEIEERLEDLKSNYFSAQADYYWIRSEIHEHNLAIILDKAKKEGWALFRFYSSYYGSHFEYGEDDQERFYLFAPQCLEQAEKFKKGDFSHGHNSSSKDYAEFENFVDNLKETWVRDEKVMTEDDFNVEVVYLEKEEYLLFKKEGIYVIRGGGEE
ncbi:MAG: hypothetical protein ACP5OE_08820 [Thermodesulfobium sp.]